MPGLISGEQVLVEAIIVELTVTDDRELGLQWLFADDSGAFGSNISPSTAQLQRNAAIGNAILGDDNSNEDIGVGSRRCAVTRPGILWAGVWWTATCP